MRPGPPVELVPVDDDVLDRLVAAAVADAAAQEVTPPVTPGVEWSAERVAWLRAFHRDRRRGLDGAAREVTWAVVVDGAVAGSVRLRAAAPGVGETGVWLTRSARGRGAGTRAVAAVVQQARELGFGELQAETTTGNAAAQAVLRAAGFVLTPGEAGVVAARLPLTSSPAPG